MSPPTLPPPSASDPGASAPQPKKPSYTFLLHCFHATGHVLPMQAVAQALVARGHRVVWTTAAAQEQRVRAAGAAFVPTRRVTEADAALARCTAPTSTDDIVEALFGGRVEAQVADLRAVLGMLERGELVGGERFAGRNRQVDCVLNDALPQGAAALYELGEVPLWATLGVVPMYTSGGAKPVSNLGSLLSTPALILPCINAQRARLGLGAVDETSPAADALHYSPFLHLQASCAALEPGGAAMAQTRYVGPLVSDKAGMGGGEACDDDELPSWWSEVEAHPRVVGVTQGTFAVDPAALLIPALEALSADPSLLLVAPSPHCDLIRAELARRLNPDSPRADSSNDAPPAELPSNVRLAPWLPYARLLPRCRALVTNGGYGSVTQALAAGVPLVCAGTSEDKRDTAARVVAVGAGIDLATDAPGRDEVRAAVDRVISDATYRDNAARVGRELNAAGGAARAARLLEEAVGGRGAE